ncbi:MAG: glutamate--tRNA ligase [Candidatus Dormibacteria bacterium]
MSIDALDASLRVRVAPSPTGPPHVGTVRTALYNYLLARGRGGTFVLRIEDTDRERSDPRYEHEMVAMLRWLGLDWDEGPDVGGPFGPYRQSERIELHRAHQRELEATGTVYRCYCTPEELTAERAAAAGRAYVYSGRCRNLDGDARARLEAEGRRHTLRFAVTRGQEIAFNDLVRGEVRFSSDDIGDFIVVKSDGDPVFLFSNAVDDADQRITHVIRGEDHLSNTPRQLMVLRALGLAEPRFGHLPLMLNTDRSKLSKRSGLTDLNDYRVKGYLPEAMVNFLAFVGWSPGTEEEVFTLPDLCARFSLERVHHAGAVFNVERLQWLNGHYLREMPLEELSERLQSFLPAGASAETLRHALPLVRERVRTLSEAAEMLDFFWTDPSIASADALIPKEMDAAMTLTALDAAGSVIGEHGADSPHEALEGALRAAAEVAGLKFRSLMTVLRVVVTGRTVSPPLLESMAILGTAVVLRRVDLARQLVRAVPVSN